ncbi:hypothetical protein SDC9_212451 [bioreactor metagenome]|uniref:Uncharacterized protein n=1 Tax=bioreactor metagenome TaxID=1076179 RepID=A0A645JM03_9ZZZZ
MVVGDVGLPVDPQKTSVRVQHGYGVKKPAAVLFKKAHRQHHAQLPRHRGKPTDGGVFLRGCGVGVEVIAPLLAEVGPLEELGEQNDVGAPPGGPADQGLRPVQIFLRLFRAAHLHGRQRHLTHDRDLLWEFAA